ncbi:MAG TPA: M56 family metallopeptidase [Longimicrobium sp.]|nr:M56 family metallopeptidase [Longimicrobium sp.]
MIAHWMLYCVAVGALLSGGAAALEKALRPLGRATRWVWAGALLLTLAIPAAARAIGSLRPAAPVAGSGETLPKTLMLDGGITAARRSRPWLLDALDPRRLQTPLAAVWIASSAASLLALAGMAGALRRRRRGWTAAEVDGVPVLVSPNVGPAVVGLLRSCIVLPRWAVDADERARALVLEHEQEHVRAGDPRLLAAALAAAVLTPWNPAVWWQLRRLRLAVEVDCDARVLRRRGDVHAYGSVLLEVGRRATQTRLAAAAAFAEPVSTLERRIRIMTAPRVRRPILRAAGFGAVAAALGIAACEAPMPTMQPSMGGTRQVAGTQGSFAKTPLTPRALLEQYYPQVLADGMPAGDIIAFVFDADGGVRKHEYIAASPANGGQGNNRLNGLTGNPDRIASVNVVKSQPGELAPTGVSLILVQLKRDGQAPARTAAAAP